jgi:hypothetical protein
MTIAELVVTLLFGLVMAWPARGVWESELKVI